MSLRNITIIIHSNHSTKICESSDLKRNELSQGQRTATDAFFSVFSSSLFIWFCAILYFSVYLSQFRIADCTDIQDSFILYILLSFLNMAE